jgi:hypothetical protein
MLLRPLAFWFLKNKADPVTLITENIPATCLEIEASKVIAG